MSALPNEWKTWSLTHVIYPKGDHYGKFLGIFSLLPHCLMVAFFTLCIFVRDIHVILFFAGQIANEGLNFVLKYAAAEGRPEQVPGKPNVNQSYGWPSSHCQFQAFFITYSTILLIFRVAVQKKRSIFFCFSLTLVNFVSLLLIVHSRLYLRYHFLHQCIHGFAVGAGFAVIWYLLVSCIIEPFLVEQLMRKSKWNHLLQLCSIYCNNEKSEKFSNAKNTKSFRKTK